MFLNQVQMFKHTVIKMCLRDSKDYIYIIIIVIIIILLLLLYLYRYNKIDGDFYIYIFYNILTCVASRGRCLRHNYKE